MICKKSTFIQYPCKKKVWTWSVRSLTKVWIKKSGKSLARVLQKSWYGHSPRLFILIIKKGLRLFCRLFSRLFARLYILIINESSQIFIQTFFQTSSQTFFNAIFAIQISAGWHCVILTLRTRRILEKVLIVNPCIGNLTDSSSVLCNRLRKLLRQCESNNRTWNWRRKNTQSISRFNKKKIEEVIVTSDFTELFLN